jgi:NRAMP (natural resistance-associated macrophage protein)-like metal ion transporter
MSSETIECMPSAELQQLPGSVTCFDSPVKAPDSDDSEIGKAPADMVPKSKPLAKADPSPVQHSFRARCKAWLKELLRFAGPGWLICIALIDPGNYEGDIQAGAGYQYALIWIIWWATIAEICIQALTIRLGLYARRDLGQACRETYPRWVTIALWILSEIGMMATDLLQVIGFGVATEILFGIPLYAGVLLSFATTLLLLSTQYVSFRLLEIIVIVLVFIMSITFFIQWGMVDTDGAALLRGWVVPSIPSGSALILLSQIGASVSPHNVFLQSALVQTRTVDRTKKALRSATMFNIIEMTIPMMLAFVVNLAVIALAAQGFYNNPAVDMNPNDITLRDTCKLIHRVYANSGAGCILFGISLLASAQSATISATYAGQIVMEGFLNIRLPLWLRNLTTRTITIVPGLFIAIFAGNNGSGLALLISSSILSGVIPFLIVPLLKFTNSAACMGPYRNSWYVRWPMWTLTLAIIAANLYLIAGAGGNRTLRQALSSGGPGSTAGIVFTVIIGLLYVGFLVYLMLRPVGIVGDAYDIDDGVMGLVESGFETHVRMEPKPVPNEPTRPEPAFLPPDAHSAEDAPLGKNFSEQSLSEDASS